MRSGIWSTSATESAHQYMFRVRASILDPSYVLVIVFTGRVWDAITDPMVGYLTSFTKTRFGRLRPWLAFAALPVGLAYFCVWFVPPLVDQSQFFKYLYYQIVYLLFQASMTCIHVPYTALTMHMTNDYKERDSVTLFRMLFEIAGTLLGILVYTAYYVGMVDASTSDCNNDGERKINTSRRAAYQWHGLTIAVIIVVCISVTTFTIKEQKDEVNTVKRIGFFRGLRVTCGFKPYFYLLMMELFAWLALQFVQGNMALFIKYSVGLEAQYPYVIATLLTSSIIFMPLWQLCIVKFGKKTTFYIGMWTIFPLLLSQLYLDKLPMAAYPLNVIGGMGVSCAYLIPWSMLPDVVDQATLVSDVRREELFYAFFVFGNKFGSGFTLAVSTAIYKFVGYNENSCEQPWILPLTLKMLVSVPAIIFILISFIFLHLYPITEKTRKRTMFLLTEKRKHQSAESTKFVGTTTMSKAANSDYLNSKTDYL